VVRVLDEVFAMIATTPATAFHLGLYVADLERSVAFYRALLGTAPAKWLADFARFEVEQPALVLVLYPSPQAPGGPLNHVGLRLTDSAMLVEVQRRLEEAGIATQRQEGVECCYARQTKFWATDPDRTLWELYTLDEDIEHSGFDDPPAPVAPPPQAVWAHHLTEAVPPRIGHGDGTLDEVLLEGTFNAALPATARTAFLAEVYRVLKPAGRVRFHGLVCDKPFPGTPKLPGLASVVQQVPLETDALEWLERAGFRDHFFERLGDIHCFGVGGVELREMRLTAVKPPPGAEEWSCPVMYKGPFGEVIDDDGTVFRRGERTLVRASQAERLRRGPAAEQFAFLPGREESP
jgi:catechol 2,3-dioxygenase-like lactoylglutathione lyase family enzyme